MGLQPGARFGRYELVSRLGRSGMAETYRARLMGEAGVTKTVLIKKVLPEYANDNAFTTMFVSEARISATLSHGNIAQVHDFGRVDGEYFLAMELVDGQPLNKLLKSVLSQDMSCLPIPIAAFIGIEMCRGLHYAHTRTDPDGKPLGIVHRDIAPDNVLISYEGQVKIVDFGIAKARQLRGFDTEPGVVKGKYLYSSPEQAKGQEVDARSDVWATGVVLYEMFCGQPPVQGPSYVAMPQLVQGQFPRPLKVNPGLPSVLDKLIMRALAVDPAARLASCHELGDALAGYLYSAEPRFSAMSLSHFLHQYFREELQSEGRQVQVPRSFLEQMEPWILATIPTKPIPVADCVPTQPDTPVVTVAEEEVPTDIRSPKVRKPPPQHVQEEERPERVEAGTLTDEAASALTDKRLYVVGGIGAAVLALLLILLMVMVMGKPREEETPSTADPLDAPPLPLPKPDRSRAKAATAQAAADRLIRDKQFAEARDRASECLALEPHNAECQLLKGLSYAHEDQWAAATPFLQRFLELAPDHRLAPKIRDSLKRLQGPHR